MADPLKNLKALEKLLKHMKVIARLAVKARDGVPADMKGALAIISVLAEETIREVEAELAAHT